VPGVTTVTVSEDAPPFFTTRKAVDPADTANVSDAETAVYVRSAGVTDGMLWVAMSAIGGGSCF
jgi:hypothetical protein